jgi:hypothetical protein
VTVGTLVGIVVVPLGVCVLDGIVVVVVPSTQAMIPTVTYDMNDR